MILRFVTTLAISLLGCASLLAEQPLKVYILVGQSNMEGHARISVMDYLGEFQDTKPLLREMKNPDGSLREIEDVWISYLTGLGGGSPTNREVFGPLIAGYGSLGRGPAEGPGEKIGPELAFGITMQQELDQPILIIKTAWGGKSLHTDFRSPSSGPYVPTEDDIRREKFATTEQQAALKAQTGIRYRHMVEHVQHVLNDIPRVVPDYDAAQGYEIGGLVWFQGFNDMVGRNVYPEVPADSDTPRFHRYTEWFGNFIRDARKDLNAPEMPVVIGVMGVSGLEPNEGNEAFRESQRAVAAMPEFRDNVHAVETAPFWDERLAAIDEKRGQIRQKANLLKTENKNHENADGSLSKEEQKAIVEAFAAELLTEEDLALEARAKSNAGYHYLGSARTMALIGQAFAQALLEDH